MRHVIPDYLPWDQRLCVVQDGDLFNAIKSGKVSVVTEDIHADVVPHFQQRWMAVGVGVEAAP